MGWKDKYVVVGIKPGRVVTKLGEVDLSNDDLPVSLLDSMYEAGSTYLKKKKLPAKKAEIEPEP